MEYFSRGAINIQSCATFSEYSEIFGNLFSFWNGIIGKKKFWTMTCKHKTYKIIFFMIWLFWLIVLILFFLSDFERLLKIKFNKSETFEMMRYFQTFLSVMTLAYINVWSFKSLIFRLFSFWGLLLLKLFLFIALDHSFVIFIFGSEKPRLR